MFIGTRSDNNSQIHAPDTATFTWADLLLFWQRRAAQRESLCGDTY